jgi:hypothetical protein
VRRIRIFALTFILVTLGVLMLHLTTSAAEFSRDNSGWDGTSIISGELEAAGAERIGDLALLSEYSDAALLIIAPHKGLSADEKAQYKAFVQRGNVLVLADEYGPGDEILEGVGSTIRFANGTLLSIDLEYNDPSTIIAYRSGDAPLVDGVRSVVLNRPAPLVGGESLLSTSNISWIDVAENGRIDANETLGPHAVIAHEIVGQGEVIVISDPSLFINAMVQEPMHDNRRLISNLIGGRKILVDETNSRIAASGESAGDLVASSGSLFVPFAVICILAAAAIGVARKADRRQKR